MNTMDKLLEISSRLEHLENCAEWIARETVHADNGVSQTGTLICVLTDEIREKLCVFMREIEEALDAVPVH